jgi:hypothetical protein
MHMQQALGGRNRMQELLCGFKPFPKSMSISLQTRRLVIMVSSTLLFGACSHKEVQLTREKLIETASQFVPQDASDRFIAPQIPWVQISFNVQRPPLQFAIDEGKLTYAKESGWIICRPKTDDWVGYLDLTMGRHEYVQTRTYMLYQHGVMITLVGRYLSVGEEASVRKGDVGSGTRTQDGMVIAGGSTEGDFRDRAASQSLECEK